MKRKNKIEETFMLKSFIKEIVDQKNIEAINEVSQRNIRHTDIPFYTKLKYAEILLNEKEYLLFLRKKTKKKPNLFFTFLCSGIGLSFFTFALYNGYELLEVITTPLFFMAVGWFWDLDTNYISVKEYKLIKNKLKEIDYNKNSNS